MIGPDGVIVTARIAENMVMRVATNLASAARRPKLGDAISFSPPKTSSKKTVVLHKQQNELPKNTTIARIVTWIAVFVLVSVHCFGQESTVSQPLDMPGHWWDERSRQSMMDQPTWVTFGLDTVLLDTLDHSPRIKIVASQASVAIERIIQQDAAFDARVLFDSRVNRNNDPVGNSLTTGGPPRLIEENLTASGGIQRTTRRGGVLDVSQELGLANSNSTFFEPADQGNSRLSLSLTQPLLGRSGQVFNERLLTQARIDSRVSWQEMRSEVETRLSDVIAAYWRLYELRCHYLQTIELLQRGKEIETFLAARIDFDAGEIELAKIRGRIARRIDREVRLRAEIKQQQASLAVLVGSQALTTAMSTMEMIPSEQPNASVMNFNLRDAVQTGIENRPEIRAATAQLESAALSIRVTRAELEPQLSAVFETYLAGLSGNNRVLNSLTDQFTQGGPGLAAGLQYELPYGRRAAKSRHREAQHRYQLRTEELREVVQQSQAEIEIALVAVNAAIESQATKQHLLDTAVTEEEILTGRWELLAGDGSSVGVVLETLLDAQSRRTDAERELVSSQTEYVVAVVQLQRAMGTLLIQTGSSPVQDRGNNTIHFVSGGPSSQENNEISVLDESRSPMRQSQDLPMVEQSDQQWLGESLGESLQHWDAKPSVVDGFYNDDEANRQEAIKSVKVFLVDQPVFDPQIINPPLQGTPNRDTPKSGKPKLDPPANRQASEQSVPVKKRRNDVSQLIDAEWLEDAMYGDSITDLDSIEDTK